MSGTAKRPLAAADITTALGYVPVSPSQFNLPFASPGPIGATTPSTGAFTTLNSTGGALNGSIGATTPSTGAFTTLSASTGFKGNGVFPVTLYGAKCDGVTDDTAAVNTAIAAASAAGGGTVLWPAGTCLMIGAFVIPYAGTSSPTQNPIRLTGAGAIQNGYWAGISPAGVSGTIINNTYTPTGGVVAKIDTRGAGVLEIDHLTLSDSGTGNGLFIFTTNTVLLLRDMTISGNPANSGTACVQNAIQFGGITSASTTLGTNAATDGFQGYGSRVTDCYFEHVKVAAGFGGSANAIYLSNNTVSKTCGSSDTLGAPYVFYGQGFGASGNVFMGGIIEISHYPYGVAMLDAGSISNTNELNYFSGLGMYDENIGAPTVGGFYFSTYSTNNTVLPGFADTVLQMSGSTPIYFAGPSATKNTLWNAGGFPSQVNGNLATTAAHYITSGGGTFFGSGDYVSLNASNSTAGLEVHAPSGATTLLVNNSASAVTMSPIATNANVTLAANGTGAAILGASTNQTELPGVYAAASYANDAAAAVGGVPLGGIYHNGSQVQIRVGSSALAAVGLFSTITSTNVVIDQSAAVAAPLTGTTVTIASGVQRQVINPAGTLAALTVALPAAPSNAANSVQPLAVIFTQAVTTLTWTGTTVGAAMPTTVAAGSIVRFEYVQGIGFVHVLQA